MIVSSSGTAGDAGRSKYCIWVRSSNGVTNHEQGPLEEVGGGQKEGWDKEHMGLYNHLLQSLFVEVGLVPQWIGMQKETQ